MRANETSVASSQEAHNLRHQFEKYLYEVNTARGDVVGITLDGLLGVRKTTGTCMCVLDNPNISVVPSCSRTIRRLLIVYVTKACR